MTCKQSGFSPIDQLLDQLKREVRTQPLELNLNLNPPKPSILRYIRKATVMSATPISMGKSSKNKGQCNETHIPLTSAPSSTKRDATSPLDSDAVKKTRTGPSILNQILCQYTLVMNS